MTHARIEAAAPPLTYSPARPRRRRIGRWAAGTLLLLAAAACWHWRSPLKEQGQIQYWQWQCAHYQTKTDTVVASAMLQSGGTPRTAAPMPPCWIAYEPLAVSKRAGNVRSSTAFTLAIAFLHKMHSPAGHERIVAVRCIPSYLPSASVLQAMQPVVVVPADPWPLSNHPAIASEGHFPGGYPVNIPVQLFAGQPDPADSAHFTIAYTVADKPGIIDGRLGDDDVVTLKVREGSPDVRDILLGRSR